MQRGGTAGTSGGKHQARGCWHTVMVFMIHPKTNLVIFFIDVIVSTILLQVGEKVLNFFSGLVNYINFIENLSYLLENRKCQIMRPNFKCFF